MGAAHTLLCIGHARGRDTVDASVSSEVTPPR
jgi:hypothetical protein